ncbi:MAG: YbfB/YjiJ family MFS transporter [Candidatus Binataceae bacterium]
MVFLVDFVARGLGQGLGAGAKYWVLSGLGGVAGPIIAGSIANRIGCRLALRLAFLVQAAAAGMLAVWASPIALPIPSVAAGVFVSGIVPLVLGRVHELTGAM